MALFEASICSGGATVQHYGPIDAAGCAAIPAGTQVKVGLWPEDITVSTTSGRGLVEGRVYATDFRGRDRALEIHFGDNRFRKVVGLDMVHQQNDAIWFHLPPERAYLFDSRNGHRMHPVGNRES